MKDHNKKKYHGRIKRHNRVRSKIYGTSDHPRFSVYKSNRGIILQLIDDESNKTLISVNSQSNNEDLQKILKENQKEVEQYSGKSKTSYLSGYAIGQKAVKKGIKTCVFDRGGFRYHGRIHAAADGARAAGIKF